MNLYTDKGFLNLDNLKFSQVYSLDKDTIQLENPKLIKTPYHSVLLATGITYLISNNSTIKGLVLDKETIDNNLDFTTIESYTYDDYIYTPFLELEDNLITPLTSIKLTNTNETILDYTNKSLIDIANNNSKKLEEVINDVEYLEDNNLLSSISNKNILNENFINFLVVSLIRGKIDTQYRTIDSHEYTCKKIAYRFKKDNKHHLDMTDKLEIFCKSFDIPYTVVDYTHYYYINIYNNPLVTYLQNFILSDYLDISKSTLSIQEYFLKTLFNYSKNNYYTNPSTFYALKSMCYRTKQVLSLNYRTNNSEEEDPICASIIHKDSCETEINPDVVMLEKGYLTRIVDIQKSEESSDIIKDYLIIG